MSDIRSTPRDPQNEPRLRLLVTHAGNVRIITCDHCTGTAEELAEVLDVVMAKVRAGVVL